MSIEQKKVRTRIAPSPSGYLHIGTARTALFNYLFARQHGGEYIMRIEDTDRERSQKHFEDDIFEGFSWLGLEYDALYRQSERTDFYVEKLDELLQNGTAYLSREKAKDDETREVEVVRLKNPGKVITFHDTVRGDITVDTTELGDFVIARSRTDPLYHFAVVVDDVAMGITHVIRGDDHISNTPRQILIHEAFGYALPSYTHLPLILATDRSKMSKRKGAVAITEYRAQGFLPSAILNYLALLGWNSGTDTELYTLNELISEFDLSHIQKSGAVFDIENLKWLNKEHRKRVPADVLAEELIREVQEPAVAEVLRRSKRAVDDLLERFSTWKELHEALEAGEYDFYEHAPTPTKEDLLWKKDKEPERAHERLSHVTTLLEAIDTATFTYDPVKDAVWAYAEKEGKGAVLWPLRYALSGKERSPDPFLLAEALGKEEVMSRLQTALQLLV